MICFIRIFQLIEKLKHRLLIRISKCIIGHPEKHIVFLVDVILK